MAKVADVPLTVVEPMACGKPVISTSVGAIPEVVQHGTNGLLVRPSSAKQLSEAINSIVQNDSLRTRFSSNARKSAELYRSDSVIGRLTNIYESV
jgi:glycosyltransferase involved in cell wall biosynthesis